MNLCRRAIFCKHCMHILQNVHLPLTTSESLESSCSCAACAAGTRDAGRAGHRLRHHGPQRLAGAPRISLATIETENRTVSDPRRLATLHHSTMSAQARSPFVLSWALLNSM